MSNDTFIATLEFIGNVVELGIIALASIPNFFILFNSIKRDARLSRRWVTNSVISLLRKFYYINRF